MLHLETFKAYWDTAFPDIRLKRSHFILAVSGGVDSIVLAHLMHTLGAKCTIAHVNFQLRGEESKRDEQFVSDFANQLNIPIKVHTCETEKYAQTYKMGIQQAAREIRYAWFGALMQEINATENNTPIISDPSNLSPKPKPVYLLTAHHANDQVETILMQLFRGTGIHGLTGIPERRIDVLNIARPLLSFSKDEIKAYANQNGLSYVEDSSNEKDDYTRNFIRNKLIPEMAEIFPMVNENIIATSKKVKEAELIVVETVNSFWKKGLKLKKGIPSIPVAYWHKVNDNATYTWGLIKNYGFKPQQIEEVHKILDASKGAYIASATYKLIQWEGHIQIVPIASEKTYTTINSMVMDATNFSDKTVSFANGSLDFELISNSDNLAIDKDPKFAYLAADKLEWPLLLRTWEPSDYFYPLGMRKKKKLNHFLGSLKLSPVHKAKQAVLCTGDKLVWVVGKRIDDRFKVVASTQKVLKIRLQETH